MSDIRWIIQKSCTPLVARSTISLAARRLARSSNHSKQQVDQFNRSKTGRAPFTGGEAEVGWRQSRVAVGLSSQCKLGVKTKVFALLIQFWWHSIGSDRKSRGWQCLRPQRGLHSASCKQLVKCCLREAASAARESRLFHFPAPSCSHNLLEVVKRGCGFHQRMLEKRPELGLLEWLLDLASGLATAPPLR